jgi:uncharacterized membrane protein YkvA (DUF1232 family)
VKIFKKITNLLKLLKKDVIVLWFVLKNPATPFLTKSVAVVTVAYAVSPVDLIPDVIPLLGYLDDLIIVPILIWITLKLVPQTVLNQSRQQALEWLAAEQRKASGLLRLMIILVISCLITWFFVKHFYQN